jgi:hypothetical protein
MDSMVKSQFSLFKTHQNTLYHCQSTSFSWYLQQPPGVVPPAKVEKRLLELKEKTEALQTQNDYLGTCHGGRDEL